jgi:hypothetical protein
MHILISILLFALVSFAAFSEQGTMSTDDTREAQAPASISGTTDKGIEAQEEEVRIEDDEYDPEGAEIDEEKMEQYQQEVQY